MKQDNRGVGMGTGFKDVNLFIQENSVLLIFVKFFQRRPGKLSPDGQLVTVMALIRQGIPGQIVSQRLQVHRVVRLLVHRLRIGPRSVPASGITSGVFRASILELGLFVNLLSVRLAAIAVTVHVSDGKSRLFVAAGVQRRGDDGRAEAVRQRLT